MKINGPISDFLSGFRTLTGTYTIFRTADEDENTRSPESSLHFSEFCLAVKKDPLLLPKCLEDCAHKAVNKAKTSGKTFVKTCHANVKEIVFPFYSNGIYRGSVFIGPYKTGKGKTYKTAVPYYLKLPEYSNSYMKGALSLLSSFFPFLLNESEKILLSSAARGTGDEKIRKALMLIKTGLSSKLSAGYLSKECGLSTSRFIHLFKEKTGYSLSDYIIKTRLEKAKTMLASKALKINEIAAECGYSNRNYFSLAFKKYTGSSPGSYKKNYILQP